MVKSDMAKERPWGATQPNQSSVKTGGYSTGIPRGHRKTRRQDVYTIHLLKLVMFSTSQIQRSERMVKKSHMPWLPWFWSSLQTNWIQLVWYFQPYFLSFPVWDSLLCHKEEQVGKAALTGRRWGCHEQIPPGSMAQLEYLNMDRNHFVASHWGFRKQWVSILEWSKDDFGLPPF